MADGFIVKRGGGEVKPVESIKVDGIVFVTTPALKDVKVGGVSE